MRRHALGGRLAAQGDLPQREVVAGAAAQDHPPHGRSRGQGVDSRPGEPLDALIEVGGVAGVHDAVTAVNRLEENLDSRHSCRRIQQSPPPVLVTGGPAVGWLGPPCQRGHCVVRWGGRPRGTRREQAPGRRPPARVIPRPRVRTGGADGGWLVDLVLPEHHRLRRDDCPIQLTREFDAGGPAFESDDGRGDQAGTPTDEGHRRALRNPTPESEDVAGECLPGERGEPFADDDRMVGRSRGRGPRVHVHLRPVRAVSPRRSTAVTPRANGSAGGRTRTAAV